MDILTNDVGITQEMRTMANTKDGCSDNMGRRGGGYELVSLSSEYGKHLSSVVLNNYNYIPNSNTSLLSFFNWIFNIDFRSCFIQPVHFIDHYISQIRGICNTTCECKCTCSCEDPCSGDIICLCLCNCAPAKGTNGCCICICKKENCKCVCICICNKAGNQCCCKSGQAHTCEKSLVKVNIQSLLSITSKILCHIRWIKCCLYKPENKCCPCSCCVRGSCVPSTCCSYCCCKYGKIKYLSVISRINWIEILFKEVGTKIHKLIKLKNVLSCCFTNETCSSVCPNGCCKDKLKDLIDIISAACRYYYRINYELKQIVSFVGYKVFYNKSEEVSSIDRSIKCLSEINKRINYYIVKSNSLNVTTNNTSSSQINNVVMSVMSRSVIDESIFLVSSLYMHYKTKAQIFEILSKIQNCKCVNLFDRSFTNFYLNKRILKGFVNSPHINEYYLHKDIDNSGNYICLCLVLRHVLLTDVYVLNNYIEYIYYDILSWISRKFKKYTYLKTHISLAKTIVLLIKVIYKITLRVKNIFNENGNCYCTKTNERYHPYLISIILFVSSLIENIWTMEPNSIGMGIEKISNLLSDYESIRFYTGYYQTSPFNIYTLLVNKKCEPAAAAKKCCCCWCVTCYNFGIILIYLSFQCKLCNALCTKKEQVCKKVENFFEIDKCDCECTCSQNQGKEVCCLLKLATCSQAPSTSAGECQDLQKKLEACCTACNSGGCDCCKKMLEKLKKGLCKLLLLGCECSCNTDTDTQVKAWCVFFNDLSERTRVAVIVFCKCKEPGEKCCCLYQLIEKLKEKAKKICQDGKCVCDDLKSFCDDICTADCCNKEKCPCKELKDQLPKICKNQGKCLCQLIKDTIGKCFEKGTCKCKDKGGCCRCVCCKIVAHAIKLLTRACRQNVLDPYKRIAIDLLGSGKDKKQLILTIINGINQTRLNNIFLVKNNLTSSSYQILKSKNTVKSRNWGYETRYEQQVTLSDNNPNDPEDYIINQEHMLDTYYIVYNYLSQ